MSQLVLIERGACTVPGCDGCTEAADGLQHYRCACGHDSAPYRLIDTYLMPAAAAWAD